MVEGAERIGASTGGDEDVYFWPADDRILWLRCSFVSLDAYARQVGLPTNTQFNPTLLHLLSGERGLPRFRATQTALPGKREVGLSLFNRRYAHKIVGNPMITSRGAIFHLPTCTVSPDGSRLLWLHNWGGGLEWITATLSASDDVVWPAYSRGSAIWKRDSRHWIELVKYHRGSKYIVRQAIVHDVMDPHNNREFPVEGLPDGLLAGLSDRDRVLIYKYEHSDADLARTQHVPFYELDLSGLQPSVKRYRISAPTAGRILRIELSPQGDKLAWLFMTKNSWWTGDQKIPITTKFSAWITNLRGAKAREVARISRSSENPRIVSGTPKIVLPSNLRWVPNGRHISFTFDKDLYTASAD